MFFEANIESFGVFWCVFGVFLVQMVGILCVFGGVLKIISCHLGGRVGWI